MWGDIEGTRDKNNEVVDGSIKYHIAVEESEKLIKISNGILTIDLSLTGEVVSLLDSRLTPPRQVLYAGSKGNKLMMYDDVPFYWDAWDVMPYYAMTGTQINGSSTDTGTPDSLFSYRIDTTNMPLELCIVFRYNDYHPESTVETPDLHGPHKIAYELKYKICYQDPLIKCLFSCDWHESHKLLKLEWPLNINSRYARYDVQHGFVERPTHRNQDTDAAMFEVCGHKYAHLSEEGYGFTLINSSKYGYSALGSTLSLSLLRAPKSPDPNCDMGKHEIEFGILPQPSQVWDPRSEEKLSGFHDAVRSAICFNSPVQEFNVELSPVQYETNRDAMPCVSSAPLFSVRCCDGKLSSPLVLDTIKMPERFMCSLSSGRHLCPDDAAVILRLYESLGSTGSATVVADATLKIKNVYLCNMREDEKECLVVKNKALGTCFDISFLPFKIYTVLVVFDVM